MLKKSIIVSVLICVFILPYVFVMRHYSISDDSARWADLGSYISGVFSLFTFFATLYIAFKIEENSNARHTKEVDIQKTLFLNDIRVKEYEKLILLLDIRASIVSDNFNDQQIVLSLHGMKNSLIGFCIQNDDIFPMLKDSNCILNIENTILEIINFYQFEQEVYDYTKLKKLAFEFEKEKDFFCKKIRQLILSN